MTIARRVAAVEGSLDPLAIVLKVIAGAGEYPSLEAYARAVAEVTVEAAPMSRIGTEVEASIRASMKGHPRDEIDRAVRVAIGDAIFRYILFLRLNTTALEMADHEGLRAAAAFYWMGCLLGGPREDDLEPSEWAEHQREQAGCWELWRSVVATMLVNVMVEEEAREELETRYLGGRPALFVDAEKAWESLVEQVDRLWPIAEPRSGNGRPRGDDDDALAGRVAERVRYLADDARISTFERIGEMPRAVAIMERRLLAIDEPVAVLSGSR